MLACIFGDGHFFLSLSKLVGEPVPLPMPRKVNTCKISASEHPKAPKRKVVPPLAPPRTLSMERDHINSLSRERANSKNITHETHCYTSNISSMEDDLVRHIKRERIHSKSKVDSTPFNEDQIDQIEKTKIDDTIDDSVSLKSSQYPNHKMDNNFGLPNSNCMESIPINPETHFEDKFSRKDKIPEIVDNVKDQESLNLSQHLSKEENTGLHSDSIELNESQENLLLLERNVISKEEENILQQDCKIKSKNIDSCDESENQDNKSYVLSNSLNKSMPKPDMIGVKSEQLKPSYQSACQRPPRAPRKRITCDEIEKTVETAKYSRPKDATSGTEMKSGFERNKETCTVISTIPKCDHFDVIREDDTLNDIIKCNIAENANESSRKLRTEGRGEESNNVKITKRTKVIRSQSSSDDFEMDSLKRQKRYLTSPPEDIAHALNLNFSAGNSISSSASQSTEQEQINAGHCINRTRDVDVNERVTGACHYITNYFSILILIILRKFVTSSITYPVRTILKLYVCIIYVYI